MVKHIVFWKIKDSNDKQQNIDHMIDMLTNLVGKIDGLVSVEMGYNFNTSSDYDVVLYAALKNAAALKYYQNHPEHIKCKDFIEKITEARVAADYFYEEEITQSRPFDEVPDAPEIKENVKPEITVEKPVAKKPVIEVSKPDAKETATKVSKPAAKMTATEVSKSVAAPVQNSTVTEKTNIFGKKKVDVQVTPLEQRSDTWTCPACGKIMPNYVGTCGCGEPKPFEFEPPVPADSADTSVSAGNDRKPVAPAKTEAAVPAAPVQNSTVTEKTNIFGKKKVDVQVTPLEQRSDTWTCPACGKIMPNYVGTCGCGEPKPFEFEPPVPAAPVQNSTVTEKTNIFGKKKVDVQVTPLEQRSDTWTCPACGKIMPNYVGTCGCGEPKPFEFEPPVPAAPVQNSTVTEKTNIFGKKKIDVQVTPLEQRSDTWTCPACGKIMPNYVGTCGCGEPKPFEFEPPVPADSADTSVSARSENKPSAKPGPRRENIKESKSFFSKKKPETSSPVPSSGSNTWTCPNCGKIMPNYVGTCGCGEPKPFEFESSEPADSSEVIFPNAATGRQNKVSPEMAAEFENVQPSIEGYNPQVNVPDDSTHSNMDFIKNDNIPKNETYESYSTSDMSFNQPKSQDSSFAPLDFENAPPPAPMRFSDEPPASMGFGNRAPTSMKFSDAPGAYQDNSINSANNAAQPMRFSSSPAPSPQPAPKHVKEERKRRFGKKAKEDEAFRQAQEIVNNRKDVPNDGTWTCPNCGKVMPKYVGTCGCGESQPFEF